MKWSAGYPVKLGKGVNQQLEHYSYTNPLVELRRFNRGFSTTKQSEALGMSP